MLTTYEESLKNLWDLNNCLETAERKGKEEGFAEGKEKGLAEGEAIGLEKGEAIGLEKGEAIGLEKGEAIGLEKGIQNVARSMKQAGMPVEEIAKFTGLTSNDIENL